MTDQPQYPCSKEAELATLKEQNRVSEQALVETRQELRRIWDSQVAMQGLIKEIHTVLFDHGQNGLTQRVSKLETAQVAIRHAETAIKTRLVTWKEALALLVALGGLGLLDYIIH